MTKRRNIELSDEILVAELHKGSRVAYAALFYRYYPAVTSFCAGILKDRNIAEDMAQDVFLSLWKHREELWCQNGTLKHFLFKACKNRVIDYLKSRYSRSHTPLADNDIPYLESSDSRAVYNQLQKDIADRVREMPAKRRDVFLMSRIESLSRKEIAERMDISEATVKKHIELALKQIRESDILKPNS